jgi:hypothetical protein
VTGLDEASAFGERLYDETLGGWPHAYRQGGVFIGVTAPSGEGVWVSRLDVDGTQLYQRIFEPLEGPLAALDQIAPGPDESVYLCGVEFEDGFVEPRGFLRRRYPVW